MITWKLLDEGTARAVWNDALAIFDDANPYQSFEWGQYRRRVSGRPVLHWAAYDANGQIVALFLGIAVSRVLGVHVITSLGGPVGDLDRTLSSLTPAILRTLQARRCYCAIELRREPTAADAVLLSTAGWRRSAYRPGTARTISLDLTIGASLLRKRIHKSFARSLQRGANSGLDIAPWVGADPAEVIRVYRAMEVLKGLPAEFTIDDVAALQAAFGSHLLMLRARDRNGTTISLRGCLMIGPRALDVYSASDQAGRAAGVSQAVWWRLMEECIRRGIQSYDLNGIDPENNPGVYRFKISTGGREVEHLGYWDWATSAPLRLLMATARRYTSSSATRRVATPKDGSRE